MERKLEITKVEYKFADGRVNVFNRATLYAYGTSVYAECRHNDEMTDEENTLNLVDACSCTYGDRHLLTRMMLEAASK